MRIKDIMSKDLIVMDENTTINEVAKTMKEYDIGFIPISKCNKIIGVITDRDLCCKAISNNCTKNVKVKDYITKNIIAIDENEVIENAIELMKQNKIKRLLIKSSNKLTGIISISDIINNSNIKILDTIKSIWHIKRNSDYYETEIDEFYL